MNTRELILLSVAILLAPFSIYFSSSNASIGDLGSLLGASAAIIAVFWFYRGLRLQTLQIDEQRKQFSKQYHIQHQDSLLSFLQSASDRIDYSLNNLIDALELTDTSQLVGAYLRSMERYKVALESTDPNTVLAEIQEWMKIEGPCVNFMNSIKDVIILHKMRLGLNEEEKEQDVAVYVYINSLHLLQQPLISKYRSTVSILSEQMMLLSPGRKSMSIASSAALAMIAPDGVVKTDNILEEIQNHENDGKYIPKGS